MTIRFGRDLTESFDSIDELLFEACECDAPKEDEKGRKQLLDRKKKTEGTYLRVPKTEEDVQQEGVKSFFRNHAAHAALGLGIAGIGPAAAAAHNYDKTHEQGDYAKAPTPKKLTVQTGHLAVNNPQESVEQAFYESHDPKAFYSTSVVNKIGATLGEESQDTPFAQMMRLMRKS